MYRFCCFWLLLQHFPKRATATGLAFAAAAADNTITPDEEVDDNDDEDESPSVTKSDVEIEIDMELVLVVVVVGVVVVVEALMASKNASRTKTLGRLLADLYTATHTSSSSSSLCSWLLSRRDGSNRRIASRLAGHDARNLSKRDAGGGVGGDDAFPLLPLEENESHVMENRRRRMSSEVRKVDSERFRIIITTAIFAIVDRLVL